MIMSQNAEAVIFGRPVDADDTVAPLAVDGSRAEDFSAPGA